MTAEPEAARFGPGARVGVVLPMPFDGPLDYRVGEGMALAPGDFVSVTLGKRRAVGVVWGAGSQEVPEARLKTVEARLDIAPVRPELRAFLERAAAYTLTPIGMMLRLATRVPELGEPARTRRVLRLAPEWDGEGGAAGPCADSTPADDTRTARPGHAEQATGDAAALADPDPFGGRPAASRAAGATAPKLTPARRRVIEVLAAHPGLGFQPVELARMAGVSPGVVRGLEEAGILVSGEVPADAPFPALRSKGAGHLSPAQAEAAAVLRADIRARRFSATLLRGVTGSGKTEVYLDAVAECLAAGRQALVLLPEVALTPGFLARVEARFGARPAEWHHGVTGAERRRVWRAAAEGRAGLVVGARSALFLPFRDLGLVVVDEEHDQSFKQEEVVLYNARDMAVLRASLEDAVAVLASATPSLESWANAEAGKYRRLDLPDRFGEAVMPRIATVDLRTEAPGRDRWISAPLARAARARLEAGEQVMLFLNRRGYAPLTLCRGCGHRFGCPDCDAWMVTHRFRSTLMCHQCGHTEPLPRACPSCGRDDRLAVCGPGVERLGEEAAELFPGARIEVVSSDLTPGAEELRAKLDAIAAGEADIVIGTQMVAKGHNFPLLTLVGVVDADMGLMGGDLRAAERTFQILHQVAGRAGRAEKPGAALIQTASPDHPVMRAMLSGDAEAFWRAQAGERERAGMPPYGRLAGVIVSGPDEAQVAGIARALGMNAPLMERAGARVFGPAPAPLSRVRGRVRMRLLVKAPKGVALQPALAAWLASVKVPSAVRVVVDIDPQSFL